jgi:pimeloyl-ACP methyl ester carboxylesterase
MIFLLFMLAVLLAVIGIALVLLAHAILRPPRMTDGKAVYLLKRLSPADLEMHFQDVTFTVREVRTNENLALTGWWIPHPAGGAKAVVLLHGYADAKVGAIAWAPTFRQLGFHILAIDLRAHGESGGTYSTGGFFERHDVDQVLNQFRAAHPQQTQQIVLFGASFGALVALAVADLRDDLTAVVLDCPSIHFRRAVTSQMNLLDAPLLSLLPLAVGIASKIAGADFDFIDTSAAIARAKCPVMVIQSADDPYVPPDDAVAIERAIKARNDASVYWGVSKAKHLLALERDPETYRAQIELFLFNPALQGRDSP